MRTLLIVLCLAFASTAAAETTNCQSKSGKATRRIELVSEPAACRVLYTRDSGKAEEKAKAVNHRDVCQRVYDQIVKTLEDGGFACS